MPLASWRELAATALIGAAGAAVALALGLPAPFLIGPAVATTIAAFAGCRLFIPEQLRNLCLLVIGISMGTSVTPEVVVALGRWPFSFAMVIVMTVVLLAVGFFLLRRLFHYDRVTALLGASPGHLGYVLSLAADLRCDLRVVGVVQSVRLLALTISVPIIVELMNLSGAGPVAHTQGMTLPVLAATLVVAVLLALLFLRLQIPAAILMAGVAVSTVTHVSGLASGAVPDWLLLPLYIVLGSQIGLRFTGVTIRDLGRAFFAGAVVTAAVAVAAAAIAAGVSAWTGIRLDAVLIAFAPGGLDTMTAMAVMLDAEPAYVGAHHVLRLLFLSFLMPFVLGRQDRAD